MRDKFIFYESWARSLSSLPDKQRLMMLDAMLQYFLTGEQPDMDDVMANAFFMQIASQMDRDAEAWEAKCAKNRENATKKKRTQAIATDGNQSLPIATDGNQSQAVATNNNNNNNSNRNNNKNNNNNDNSDDVNIILSQRPTIVEAIQRKFKLTQAQVIQYANQFNDHCRIGLTTHKDEQDHLQHFRDWLKIQIQEQKKHGTSNNTSYEQRASEASELVAELLVKCDEVRNEGGVPIDF